MFRIAHFNKIIYLIIISFISYKSLELAAVGILGALMFGVKGPINFLLLIGASALLILTLLVLLKYIFDALGKTLKLHVSAVKILLYLATSYIIYMAFDLFENDIGEPYSSMIMWYLSCLVSASIVVVVGYYRMVRLNHALR